MKVNILDSESISRRIKRMAFEVYESNFDVKELVMIGIDERGGFICEKLCSYLEHVSELSLVSVSAKVDRNQAPGEMGIEIDIDLNSLLGKHLIVVDDVLYTGNTMLNVVAILLQAGPQKIQTAVLIDRGHRSMPVSPDFVGVELATTIQQHVSVEISGDSAEAFLL